MPGGWFDAENPCLDYSCRPAAAACGRGTSGGLWPRNFRRLVAVELQAACGRGTSGGLWPWNFRRLVAAELHCARVCLYNEGARTIRTRRRQAMTGKQESNRKKSGPLSTRVVVASTVLVLCLAPILWAAGAPQAVAAAALDQARYGRFLQRRAGQGNGPAPGSRRRWRRERSASASRRRRRRAGGRRPGSQSRRNVCLVGPDLVRHARGRS